MPWDGARCPAAADSHCFLLGCIQQTEVVQSALCVWDVPSSLYPVLTGAGFLPARDPPARPLGLVCQPNEDSLKTSSVQGSRLGQHFSKMSSKRFCRRGPRAFPWEPYPRHAGPPPPHAHGPWDAWHDPPWEHQHWRARGRMHLPGPRQPRPFPGPADIHWNEENWGWDPQDCEEPPPPWMEREDHHGHEEMFVKDLQPIPQLRHWDFFAQPEFPGQEHHPAEFLWEQEVFQDNFSPQHHRGPRQKRCRLLRPIRQETASDSRSPQSSQGHHPSSKPSQSSSPASQPGVKEHLGAPQSPTACKKSLQSEKQVDEGLLAANSQVLEQPGHAEKSPEKSPETSPGTDPQEVEQEPAAESKPVEPEVGEEVASNQQPSASELEPVSPEMTSTKEDEGLELIPLEATAEPSTQPSTASSSVCTEAAAPAGTEQHPWGWTELAAGFQSLPLHSTHSPTSTDPRSAAILTKKESIEQGYHDFCLNFAMVSIMLLQKEPSMEGVLMKALRDNLCELRNRLIKEMEDFIQEYDELHPSC